MRLLLLFAILAVLPLAQAQTNGAPPAAATPTPAATSPATNGAAASSSTNGPPAVSPANAQTLQDVARMIRNNDLDGALTKLNAFIQANPTIVNAYVLRGQVYSEKKMPVQEGNDFQSAHLLDPTNPVVNFDSAEVKFTQKSYDEARAGFVDLTSQKGSMIAELAAYKVFLCDLLGNHPDAASKEFDAFNKVGSGASYYYANVAWDVVHHQTEDARGWLASASQIYAPQKNALYSKSLEDLGILPLPPAPGA